MKFWHNYNLIPTLTHIHTHTYTHAYVCMYIHTHAHTCSYSFTAVVGHAIPCKGEPGGRPPYSPGIGTGIPYSTLHRRTDVNSRLYRFHTDTYAEFFWSAST